MKRFLLMLLLAPLMLLAQKPEELVKNPQLYVHDYADVYTPAQENELDKIIRTFHDTTQFALVTINSFGDIAPADYALRLGRRWGVGSRSNNGIVIILGIKDRHIEVATGPGVEGDLPDALVVQLQRDYAVPQFKKGDYFNGSKDLLLAYIDRLSPSSKAIRAAQERKQQEIAAQQRAAFLSTLGNVALGIGCFVLLGLPFYLSWRNKKRLLQQLKEAEEKERIRAALIREKREQQEINERIARIKNEQLLLRAESVLKTYPKSSTLKAKWDHDVAKSKYVDEYKNTRVLLRNLIDKKDYASIAMTLALLDSWLAKINYIAPSPQQVAEAQKKKQKQQEEKEAEEEEARRKRKRREEEEERRRKDDDSYSSSNSWSSSDDSSSSSSSDYGGGSFSGGGGGSDW